MQPVTSNLSNGFKSDGNDSWKVNIIKKKVFIFNPTDKYRYCLIFKFIPITKRARFTLEQMDKIIIRDEIIEQEKKVLIKTLYNKEAILAWDFTEIGKVKR